MDSKNNTEVNEEPSGNVAVTTSVPPASVMVAFAFNQEDPAVTVMPLEVESKDRAKLTQEEFQQFKQCEATIREGLASFVEVGQALDVVRRGRLYRQEFSSFEEYCRHRWDMSVSHAYRKIATSNVVGLAAATGTKNKLTEAQARELIDTDPSEIPTILKAAEQAANGKQVTGAAIRSAKLKHLPKNTQEEDFIETSSTDGADAPALVEILGWVRAAIDQTSDYEDSDPLMELLVKVQSALERHVVGSEQKAAA